MDELTEFEQRVRRELIAMGYDPDELPDNLLGEVRAALREQDELLYEVA